MSPIFPDVNVLAGVKSTPKSYQLWEKQKTRPKHANEILSSQIVPHYQQSSIY